MHLSATSSLVQRFRDIRRQTEALCHPLQTEDFVVQPIVDVSPPKWHLGHTTWFFENFILAKFQPGYQLFHAGYNYFFNSYYESQGPRVLRSNRGNMTRPSAADIFRYRQHVDEHLSALLENNNHLFEDNDFVLTLEVGLQHEQQHQELLVTDLKYILGNNPLFPVYQENSASPAAQSRPASWLEFESGLYQIGHRGDDFCWDNELSAHRVYLEDFAVLDRLITNGEYLEFMHDGGYQRFEYWLSEGWEWAKQLEEKAPLYWYHHNGEWWNYTLHGFEKVNPGLPVTHLSYFEADAFANWKGFRLPTEFEWEIACKLTQNGIPPEANFLENGHFHPLAAQHTQFFGDVWEWTSSAYLPYPNYPRFKGALGEYNGKFMINQMVLRGGSAATPRSHIRATYRNFFHTDKRWQFTGIRLAKSL
ncbi:MAG: ergothioneine biosynthesis protein EgtB [Saprospiraceae bacterium]|nr:ergothioneine biosynthesis protein EgtB [Saprospiraceae bacterium]